MSENQSSASDFNRDSIVPRLCSVEGCERKHCGHGYCRAHLARLHDFGDLRVDVPIGGPRRKRKPEPVTHEEFMAQANAALDALREYTKEKTS